MKFSVASRIWEPDAGGAAGAEDGWGVDVEGWWVEGSAIVAGRLTRRRSVARGHSIWKGQLAGCFVGRKTDPRRQKVERKAYIPLALESLQVHELPRNSLVTQVGFILL